MKIPFRHADFLGRPVRVRWGDRDRKHWNPEKLLGQVDYPTREITLNPSIRGNRVLALGTLIHEHLHIVDREMLKLSATKRGEQWESEAIADWWFPHSMYNRVAYPIAAWLIANGADLRGNGA